MPPIAVFEMRRSPVSGSVVQALVVTSAASAAAARNYDFMTSLSRSIPAKLGSDMACSACDLNRG